VSALLQKLALAIAVVAFAATIAIAIARTDLPEERSGNQEPAAVQRVDEPGRGG
jgi:hypothetical protein